MLIHREGNFAYHPGPPPQKKNTPSKILKITLIGKERVKSFIGGITPPLEITLQMKINYLW